METGGQVVGHAVGAVLAPLGEHELTEGVFSDAVEVPAPETAVIAISAEYGYGYAYLVEGVGRSSWKNENLLTLLCCF